MSAAGYRVLVAGGNAIDATLAMASMTWLALPGQCGIGGDAFAVVREPDGSVWTVGGSGYGPDGGTLDFYADKGFSTIPLDGPFGVAVPGAPAALAALHARGATRSLSELWEPAARAAERGVPCSQKTQNDVREAQTDVAADPGLSSVYLTDRSLPRIGQRIAQPELAQTIRDLAANPSDFYLGSFAQRAVHYLQDAGVPFSGEEWAAGVDASVEAAISGPYAGAVIHQTAMPSPGWMVLQQAALCDRSVGFTPWMTAAAIDRMAGAARIAFEDRFALCGSDTEQWQTLLDHPAVELSRATLDARSGVAPGRQIRVAGGDTTSTVVVDSEGRAVSFIHSLAFTFGAKVTVPGTGVVLNNRYGRGAYLIPGHPNAAKPRRKPLHTINAWIATDTDGNLLHAGNTPGGDGQVQWNMQLLSHLLDHGLDPAEAVSAPRFTVHPGSDSDVLGQPVQLRCESRVGPAILAELGAYGHDVVVQDPWGGGGSALVISVDQTRGLISGAADPRQEGIAIGV